MTFAFFLLNFIQAVAEFLPISSSGHLIIVEWLYGISEHGIEAFLHLPTTVAILIVFFSTFVSIIKDRKTWKLILAAILPAGIVGFLLGDYIDAIFYSPIVVGINSILWGGVMWHTAINYHKHVGGTKDSWKSLNWQQSLKIGLFQILALIPGTSRSGVTTLSGIWQGVIPQQSAAFSFIIGFPLTAAAASLGTLKLLNHNEILTALPTGAIIGGMLMSLLLGVMFMKLFMSKHTLLVMKISGIYRIILGTLILVWLT
ncbi:undecaprenyl-diphosphate phosphatase [bacterium]|nr:undecaprenyl-diphosphate phosphatase [bacterium]